MLKTLIIATLLPPTLAIAQRSQQLPQPRESSLCSSDNEPTGVQRK
jgi:hypothetical protein